MIVAKVSREGKDVEKIRRGTSTDHAEVEGASIHQIYPTHYTNPSPTPIFQMKPSLTQIFRISILWKIKL